MSAIGYTGTSASNNKLSVDIEREVPRALRELDEALSAIEGLTHTTEQRLETILTTGQDGEDKLRGTAPEPYSVVGLIDRAVARLHKISDQQRSILERLHV